MSQFRGVILRVKPEYVPKSWLIVSHKSHPAYVDNDGFVIIPSERKVVFPKHSTVMVSFGRDICCLTEVINMREEDKKYYDESGPQMSGDMSFEAAVYYGPMHTSLTINRVEPGCIYVCNSTEKDIVVKTGEPLVRVLNEVSLENVKPFDERHKAIFG